MFIKWKNTLIDDKHLPANVDIIVFLTIKLSCTGDLVYLELMAFKEPKEG